MSSRPVCNLGQWEAAWLKVARLQFEAFHRASSKSEASEIWHRGQVLDDARKLLADAMSGGDLEQMALLDPINPYKEID